MTDTWISDGVTHALLADPAEVEAWGPRGWAPTDPPTHEDFLFMWRDGIAEPGRVPVYALRNLWGPRGWVAGPPPGGAHPAAPKPAAEPAASKSSKSASAAEVKEKTGA